MPVCQFRKSKHTRNGLGFALLLTLPLYLAYPYVALASSTIVVPLSIKVEVIRAALEAKVPPSDVGARDNVLGSPVTSSRLSWTFNRGPIALLGDNDTLTAGTSISGFVRIEGEAQLIRGDLGRILGRINPTRIPFSQHADLAANVSITAKPVLRPDWRLLPNIAASAQVTDASIPIAGIAEISVRGEVQPRLDEKMVELVNQLNADLATDPFIENAASAAWGKLCSAHKINGIKNGTGASQALWIVVEPQAAHILPVSINAERLQVTVGITADTRLTDVEEKPACVSLPHLSPSPTESGFALSVPTRLTYQRISDELTKAAKDKPFAVGDAGIKVNISRVEAAPDQGDRLKISTSIEIDDGGFLDWIFGGTKVSIVVVARPVLDTDGKALVLEDLTFAAGSDDLLNIAGLASSIGRPLIERQLQQSARVDLRAEEERALAKAREAIAELKAKDLNGITLSEAELVSVGLEDVKVQSGNLDVLFSAHGKVALSLDEVQLK